MHPDHRIQHAAALRLRPAITVPHTGHDLITLRTWTYFATQPAWCCCPIPTRAECPLPPKICLNMCARSVCSATTKWQSICIEKRPQIMLTRMKTTPTDAPTHLPFPMTITCKESNPENVANYHELVLLKRLHPQGHGYPDLL